MKHIIGIFLITVLTISTTHAQGPWSWKELSNMPMRTSNNGVASAVVNDTTFVYSFAGIDSTKQFSGIHLKSFKYNTITNTWSSIPDLPDSLGGVVALSATTIKNKIYVIGGYQVYSNNTEFSSYEVHIFDPATDTYSKGKRLPTSIDDHVHFAYQDSLIYIITGWTSDLAPDQNTNKVQIYDPANDTWLSGTAVPNTNSYKCFGGSGELIGNEIYYAGGVEQSNFSLTSYVRKGVIDETDPTNITWSLDTVTPNPKLYRSIAVNQGGDLHWIGGAGIPYNFDGLSYAANSPVDPINRILRWSPDDRNWIEYDSTPYQIMDLRGIAKIADNKFIIAGGMEVDTLVSNRTFELTFDPNYVEPIDSSDTTNTSVSESLNSQIKIYPNPTKDLVYVEGLERATLELYDLTGKKVLESNRGKFRLKKLPAGQYKLVVSQEGKRVTVRSIIKEK